MAAFATLEDLAARLQVDLASLNVDAAVLLLDSATGIIKGEADGQQIEQSVDDSIVVQPSRGLSSLVWLPQHPVTAVASVTVDGVVLVADRDYTWTVSGMLWRGGRGVWASPVAVVYTHGYPTVPDDLRAVCVDMAARAMANPTGSTSIRQGEYSESWNNSDAVGLGLLDYEKTIVRRYGREVLAGA